MTFNNCEDETCDGTPLMPLSLTTLPPELLLIIFTHLPTPSCLVLRRVSHLFTHLVPKPTRAEPVAQAIESPSPASLSTLPSELLLAIIAHLETPDRLVLRSVCRFFFDNIPRPTHPDLLSVENEDWAAHNFFTCGGCVRLRKTCEFAKCLTTLAFKSAGPQAQHRFCSDCGIRDLPGEYRYGFGDRWGMEGAYWMRCRQCEKIAKVEQDINVGLCRPCYLEVAKGSKALSKRIMKREEVLKEETAPNWSKAKSVRVGGWGRIGVLNEGIRGSGMFSR